MICLNESAEQTENAGTVVRAPLGTNVPLVWKDDEDFFSLIISWVEALKWEHTLITMGINTKTKQHKIETLFNMRSPFPHAQDPIYNFIAAILKR